MALTVVGRSEDKVDSSASAIGLYGFERKALTASRICSVDGIFELFKLGVHA